jgi:hypothetical protein
LVWRIEVGAAAQRGVMVVVAVSIEHRRVVYRLTARAGLFFFEKKNQKTFASPEARW